MFSAECKEKVFGVIAGHRHGAGQSKNRMGEESERRPPRMNGHS